MENTYYGIRGIVTDTSGNPVKAKMEIATHDFDNSEVYSDSLTGAYYRMIAAGTYTLTFSADNYISQTIPNVQAINFQSTVLNVHLVPNQTPVELVLFTAVNTGRTVELNWETATETNNKGFEVERSQNTKFQSQSDWINIGYVEGNGTSTESHSYSFNDENIQPGKYHYRLKQIDFNGRFEYTQAIEVEVSTPEDFSLEQNYPNPFNPTTSINFTLPQISIVTLKVYDVLGREISTLVNEEREAGSYSFKFNGSELSSGFYFYTVNAGNYTSTKKMLLIK
jgi:hypothetical protein